MYVKQQRKNGRTCEPFHLMNTTHSYQCNAAAEKVEDGTKPKQKSYMKESNEVNES